MSMLHTIKEPLQELNNMIGMKELKNNIVDQILYFVQELHKSKYSDGDFMHTVIYGAPGTGKTEIAKIMGKIYSKLGILTKGTTVCSPFIRKLLYLLKYKSLIS
jgi:Holliday junction resolvasome RuvABC ATP-dependent DNA helicase subunit